MRVLNIGEVKRQFFELIESVEKGDTFIIARAGKPFAKVTPVDDVKAGIGPENARDPGLTPF